MATLIVQDPLDTHPVASSGVPPVQSKLRYVVGTKKSFFVNIFPQELVDKIAAYADFDTLCSLIYGNICSKGSKFIMVEQYIKAIARQRPYLTSDARKAYRRLYMSALLYMSLTPASPTHKASSILYHMVVEISHNRLWVWAAIEAARTATRDDIDLVFHDHGDKCRCGPCIARDMLEVAVKEEPAKYAATVVKMSSSRIYFNGGTFEMSDHYMEYDDVLHRSLAYYPNYASMKYYDSCNDPLRRVWGTSYDSDGDLDKSTDEDIVPTVSVD